MQPYIDSLNTEIAMSSKRSTGSMTDFKLGELNLADFLVLLNQTHRSNNHHDDSVIQVRSQVHQT